MPRGPRRRAFPPPVPASAGGGTICSRRWATCSSSSVAASQVAWPGGSGCAASGWRPDVRRTGKVWGRTPETAIADGLPTPRKAGKMAKPEPTNAGQSRPTYARWQRRSCQGNSQSLQYLEYNAMNRIRSLRIFHLSRCTKELVIFMASLFAVLANDSLAQQTSATTQSHPIFNSTVLAAVIACLGVIVSAMVSWKISSVTARRLLLSEHTKRQSDLALKISDMVSSSDTEQRYAAMRRFAVAVIKITEPAEHGERGVVYFIPMNSRVTVGRSEDNDIVLADDNNSLSRWHCGFSSDQKRVWIDDYHSLNGTVVRQRKISEPTLLNSGDVIEIGPFRLHFQTIKENTILVQ